MFLFHSMFHVKRTSEKHFKRSCRNWSVYWSSLTSNKNKIKNKIKKPRTKSPIDTLHTKRGELNKDNKPLQLTFTLTKNPEGECQKPATSYSSKVQSKHIHAHTSVNFSHSLQGRLYKTFIYKHTEPTSPWPLQNLNIMKSVVKM